LLPFDAVPVKDPHFILAHHSVSSSAVLEHPARSPKAVCSNQIWNSDFFPVDVVSAFKIITSETVEEEDDK